MDNETSELYTINFREIPTKQGEEGKAWEGKPQPREMMCQGLSQRLPFFCKRTVELSNLGAYLEDKS